MGPANLFHESRETPGGCHGRPGYLLSLAFWAPRPWSSCPSSCAQPDPTRPSSRGPAVFPKDFRSPAVLAGISALKPNPCGALASSS